MQQAAPFTIYARTHSDPGRLQWVIVIAMSLFAHVAVLLWVSSHRPDFPNVTFSEFEVGLVASEGIGQTLQASRPVITFASEVDTSETESVLPEESLEDTAQDQLAEISPVISNSADMIPAQVPLTGISDENIIKQSSPAEAVELVVAPAVTVESEITEAGVSDSELTDAETVHEFFQPESIVPDDPHVALPIEEVSEVTTPEEVAVQETPELANDRVEILEIKATDISLPRSSTQSGRQTGADTQHLEQSADADNSGETSTLGLAGAEQTLAVPRSYIIMLKDWLNKYKRYPPQAYQLRQEGVAILGLKIDRSGQVLSYTIKRTSGHLLLDQAVEQMIDSATRMPALPDDFPHDSLELLVPVRFKVK